MKARGHVLNEKEYARLLARTLPRVIRTEEETARRIAIVEGLLQRPDRTPEEDQLMALLTLLVEQFEDRHYSLAAASPIDVLRHLIEANGLRQVDLVDVFGTASSASEVLNGKRALAKSHIAKLSQRFNVSPELFFEAG